MSHFAQIDENNIVIQVIVAEQDFIDSGAVGDPSKWIQTSYNNNFRKQYAGIGYIYDAQADVFISPQPFPSWTLDSDYDWEPPVPYPNDGKCYIWDEEIINWLEVPCAPVSM
jgi:hypothetical protein